MRYGRWLVQGGMAALVLSGTMVLGASQKDDALQTIEIHAKKFEYRPAEITLRKGETYRLHLTSDDVLHSLRIRELGLNGVMKPDEFTDVLFTPTQVGDFRAGCGIYCGAGHKTMELIVHVVEK